MRGSPGRQGGAGMASPRARAAMLERLAAKGIEDPRVLQAMDEVPRHLFVDAALVHRAYRDEVLPIGHRQTISHPLTVALMTQTMLQGREGEKPLGKVLEIGVGCGYQTAILARFAERVWGLERIAPLLQTTTRRLRGMGLWNLNLRHSDGHLGWPEPSLRFDTVLCAAAPPEEVPQPLVACLEPGGRLLIPVGAEGSQRMVLVTRAPGGELRKKTLGSAQFVPLAPGLEGR